MFKVPVFFDRSGRQQTCISDRQTVECFASQAKKVAYQVDLARVLKEEPATMANKHEGSRRAHKSKKNTNIKAIIDLRGRYKVQGAHGNVCHTVLLEKQPPTYVVQAPGTLSGATFFFCLVVSHV